MKIIVENADERQLMMDVCDVCLKAGGLKNYDGVTQILQSIPDAPKPETEEVKED